MTPPYIENTERKIFENGAFSAGITNIMMGDCVDCNQELIQNQNLLYDMLLAN